MVKYNPKMSSTYNMLKRKNREDMAKTYRSMRKDNPAMARLLFKRINACTQEMIQKLLNG